MDKATALTRKRKDIDFESSAKRKVQCLPKKYASLIREKETDENKIKSRQKQVDYGKNTIGYENYVKEVPKEKRKPGDPQTPDIHQICSKRSWDGQIKKWRKQLHKYDPPQEADEIVIDFGEDVEVDISE